MKIPKKEALALMSKSQLIKKESKRTTFKLSKKAHDALDWMVDSYNVTAKEVFDILCSADEILDLAGEIAQEQNDTSSSEFVRKSFVISQHSLSILNSTSALLNISRDNLVEKLILLYKELLNKYLKEERKNEEKALEIISEFWGKVGEVEKQMKTLLSDNNPIIMRLSTISIITGNLVNAIESKISDGTPVDPDDL